MNADVIQAIKEAAVNHQIEAALIAAFVMQESKGNTFATRFEMLWKYLVDPVEWAQHNGISTQTEKTEQATSWGLMQIMGSRARELGFKGYYPELCSPGVGVHYGCLDLKSIAKRYNLDGSVPLSFTEDLACAYNHGSPERKSDGTWVVADYVGAVKSFYETFKRGVE